MSSGSLVTNTLTYSWPLVQRISSSWSDPRPWALNFPRSTTCGTGQEVIVMHRVTEHASEHWGALWRVLENYIFKQMINLSLLKDSIPQVVVAIYLIVEEFGDVWEEFKTEVQFYFLWQGVRCHAAACVPAHLTGLCPQTHLQAHRKYGSAVSAFIILTGAGNMGNTKCCSPAKDKPVVLTQTFFQDQLTDEVKCCLF